MKVGHRQYVIGTLLGVLAALIAWATQIPSPFAVGANVFFLIYSVLILAEMRRMTPDYLHANARSADLPVYVIFIVTLLIVSVAVASLFVLINRQQGPSPLNLAVALLSVPLGWFTIQAMASIHYAHLYWIRDDDTSEDGMKRAGGLDFPGDEPPDGFDFLYFAATIGMTAQTADVAVTSSGMRKTMTVHAIVSFFFNAVIVAAAVNVAVTLGN